MKKSLSVMAAVVAVASLFVGCKSAKPVYIQDYSPITVVSVYSNSSVPWYVKDTSGSANESTTQGGLISSSLNKVLEANNPEYMTVNSRIDDAADTLVRLLEDNGVQVTDKSLLQDTTMYKSGFNKFMQKLETSTCADGYMIFDYNGKKRNRNVAAETGGSGTLFAEFIFQKQKVAASLTSNNVAARVTLKVYVADANGNKILYKTYTAVSSDSIPYNNGNWDRNVVVGYFPAVVESVVNQFILDYTGYEPVGEEEKATEEVVGTSLSLPTSVKAPSEESANEN